MSTKIWEAYRVPAVRLNEFIDIAHEQAWKDVCKAATDLMHVISDEALKREMEARAGWYSSEEARKDYMENSFNQDLARFRLFSKMTKDAAQSPERSVFDLTCGFNIWLHDEYAYIIPIGEPAKHGKYPKWVEDYHYQNQTDKPRNISERRWNERRDTWEKICLGEGVASHNARRLYHEILSPLSFMGMGDLEFAVIHLPRINKKKES